MRMALGFHPAALRLLCKPRGAALAPRAAAVAPAAFVHAQA